MAKTVESYFEDLDGPMATVAAALREAVDAGAPATSTKLAWGFPCWSGNERILSVVAHKAHCNLQLFNGNRLADRWPDRIEGTGNQLRHVKVRSAADIDDELRAIIAAAVELDATDPEKVR